MRYRRQAGRSGFSIVAVLVLTGGLTMPAFAQDEQEAEEAAEETSPAQQQVARAQPETMVVTGTRILRTGFDTLEPATSISDVAIQRSGFTNIADVLNLTPGFGEAVSPDGDQSSFGVGLNFVNRFGLGTARTLTLINGRRVVSANTPSIFGPAAPGLQVDLNIIPTQLIDRVENLAVGGAPTYGSDAIAGVVNVILKNRYEGLEANATYGITSRGDNARYNLGTIGGMNFFDGRGNVTLSLNADLTEGVGGEDRPRTRRAYFFSPNPTSAILDRPGQADRVEVDEDGKVTRFLDGRVYGTPFSDQEGGTNAVFIRDRRIYSITPGGLLAPTSFPFQTPNATLVGFGPDNLTYLQFNPAGDIVPYDPGHQFGFVDASGGDGLRLFELLPITNDVDRYTANLFSTFDINNSVEAFFEGLFYRAESTEIIDQSMYNSALFGGRSQAIQVSSQHPLLSDQARAALAENNIDTFWLNRASTDLVLNNAEQSSETMRGVLGLRGQFEDAGRDYHWEVYANLGRSDARFHGTALNQQNFVNAMSVSMDGGQVVCDPGAGATSAIAPGDVSPVADANCVPLNLFGFGAPSREAINYVTESTRAQAVLNQEVYHASLTGPVVSVPAGEIAFAAGAEARVEKARFTVNDFMQDGRGRAVPISPNAGRYQTNEWFAELYIPLAAPHNDIPLLRRLDLTGKFRRVNNSIAGGFNTFTYGAQYRPFDAFELRGNVTRSLRAPAITELFTPESTFFTFMDDPCDSRFINGGTKPEVRRANCEAFLEFYGLEEPFTSVIVSATQQGVTGGNENLKNEDARAHTYGFVFRPTRNLTMSLDYIDIDINGVIATLEADDLATGCFDNDSFNVNDIPNANRFCSQIIRNAPGTPNAGQVTVVREDFVNGDFRRFRGLESVVEYRLDLGDIGMFEFGAIASMIKETRQSLNGIVVENFKRELNNNTQQFMLNTHWQRGPLGLGAQGIYLGRAIFNNNFTPQTRDQLAVGSYFLTNANASYNVFQNTTLRLSVTNLFDREPPLGTTGIGNPYDILGRRFALTLSHRFM